MQTDPQRGSRVPQPNAWPLVLCLVGLDYFSTLAYLPSIAVAAAGSLAPLAAAMVVAVTFLVALPVYWYVVGHSPAGRGTTGLVEQTMPGWRGKLLVLTLLGFAAADFVITRSLSVADAATHLIHNPHARAAIARLSIAEDWAAGLGSPLLGRWLHRLFEPHTALTIGLSLLTFAFWWMLKRGFTRNILLLAAAVVVLYLGLTGWVVGSSLAYLARHPEHVDAWWNHLVHPDGTAAASDGVSLAGAWLRMALWSFPQMALGLSGFELIMTVAPQVRGAPAGQPDSPAGRVRNTRKLMVAAASIMAVYMLGAVLVTTLLVPREALAPQAPAEHRALAYLAHGGLMVTGESASVVHSWFGHPMGDLYDLSSIVILSLAGASVTMGLRGLLPHYLHRLGMEVNWAGRIGVVVQVLNVMILVVTVVFRASLSAQQWAYATSVLVLLAATAYVAARNVFRNTIAREGGLGSNSPSENRRGLAHFATPGEQKVPVPLSANGSPSGANENRRRAWLRAVPFALACLFLLAMTALTLLINWSGLVIASAFVASILLTSFFSRWMRSTEMRFEGFAFQDEASRMRWEQIRRLPHKILVPHRPGQTSLATRREAISREFRLAAEVPVIFIEATLGDPSDFYQAPLLHLEQEDGLEVLRVAKCVSVAHVLASICVEIAQVGPPPEMIFGWSQERPLAANLNFLLLGEGNIPWMVKSLVLKALGDPKRQPRIVIG